MNGKQLMLPSKTVTKSNVLCRATWAADAIWEARLIAIVAAQVQPDDEEFHKYNIPISSVFVDEEHKGGSAYKLLDKTTDNILSHVIKVLEDDGSVSKYTIFSKCNISRSRDTIEVSFHPDLKPHYLKLKERFTQYNLLEFMVLPSVYSQRIFEILKSYDEKNEIIIQVLDLYNMLDMDISIRNYQYLRRKILDKATKSINEKTSLQFTWEPIKTKNKVTAIKFIFKKETPKEKIKIKIKQQINHITEQKTNTAQFNPDYNSAVNCLIAHPTTCTPHIDDAPEVCAVCPRYIQGQKN